MAGTILSLFVVDRREVDTTRVQTKERTPMSMSLTIGGITDRAGIPILAWSWGMSNSGSPSQPSGRANVQDMSFTKHLDITSPLLELFCLSGRQAKDAVFTASYPDRSTLTITMQSPLIVTSVSSGGSEGDAATEDFSLGFGQVRVDFRDASGRQQEFGWNVLAGRQV